MTKIICCIHDKKSDLYEGFMVYNNTNEAIRSFEITCQQNETFQKWPEDFQFVHVGIIKYENGELEPTGEILKKGKLEGIKPTFTIIAEAKDFVKKENAKNTKKN